MRGEARSNRLVAWALAGLLFALGAAAGVAADRLLLSGGRGARRGPPSAEQLADRMSRELDLDDRQREAVLEILRSRQRALASLFEQVDPQAAEIRAEANGRIRAVLGPGQRERFDARVTEMERRRAEFRRQLEAGGPRGER